MKKIYYLLFRVLVAISIIVLLFVKANIYLILALILLQFSEEIYWLFNLLKAKIKKQ